MALTALLVTHEHPDHVAGFPLLLERLWLMGRRTPLPVYGPAPALAQVARTHDAFDLSEWSGYAGYEPHEVALEEGAHVGRFGDLSVTAAPGRHAVPTLGFRFATDAGGVAAYSGDSAPDPRIARLARDADLLIHEATGAGPYHASAEQAAELAREAGAKRTVLVHLPPRRLLEPDLAAARAIDPTVVAGSEGQSFSF